MTEQKPYWFKRRVYGLGWGMAGSWQGWAVYSVFLLLGVLAAVYFSPSTQPEAFAASLIGLAVALLVICWIKGEPPSWRWGRD